MEQTFIGMKNEVAFQGLKRYLTFPPLLSKPITGENTVLLPRRVRVRYERSSGSRGRRSPKTCVLRQQVADRSPDRYQRMKKLAHSLRHIEEAEILLSILSVTMLTKHPLLSIIEYSKDTGRIAKWAAELNPYNITTSNLSQGWRSMTSPDRLHYRVHLECFDTKQLTRGVDSERRRGLK